MADVHREVETTYAVDDGAALPDLAGAVPRAHAVTVATQRLRATYHDTVDLRLARAGLTLRRRTGGGDAGWHLKVPETSGARSEIRLPPGRADAGVPTELQRLVRARTRGVPLVPVARVSTVRTVHRLVAGDGTVLVEVADDQVEGDRLAGDAREGAAGADATTRWREIEAEVVDGDADDLAALDAVLRRAGLRPVPDASKVRRVLDVEVDDAPQPPGKATRSASSAEVVLASVRAHVERMAEQDLRVRLEAPGSVHAMRVATRRLRSALATFRPLFLDDVTRPVRAHLRRLARELGAARDVEVLRGRLLEALAADAGPDADAVGSDTDGSADGDGGAVRRDADGTDVGSGGTDAGSSGTSASVNGTDAGSDGTDAGSRGAGVSGAEPASPRAQATRDTGPDAPAGHPTGRATTAPGRHATGPGGRDAEQDQGQDVEQYVDEVLDRAWRDAHRRVLAELDGERYLDLLVALDGVLAAPPLRHRGSRRARTVLPRLVERTWQRTASAVEQARAATDPGERDALLHEARKAAKRARYAAEAIQPAFGSGAARFAAAMEDVQEALGAHHDAVVARARVRELAERAPNLRAAFLLGRLHAHEEVRAAVALEDAETAWRRAGKPGLRRWLR